jgi:nucleotide-binding universal stress UspA family protein
MNPMQVLLPTDFSDTSMKAAEFAFALFGTGETKYTLVHAYLKPAYGHVLLPAMVDTRKAAENGLRRAEQRLRRRAGKVHIAKVASFELLQHVLNGLAEKRGAQFIVMGTQGEGNYGRVGRNTVAVVTDARLPVIAVPSGWEPERVKSILLADDGGELTADLLAPLITIAKLAMAHVEVVHVRNADGPPGGDRRRALLSTLLHAVPHSWEEVDGGKVVEVLNDQARIRRTQLVAVVRRKKSLLDRILAGSTSKKLALHTTEPLLVLRDRVA